MAEQVKFLMLHWIILFIPYRHPIAGSRPKFRELVIALTDHPLDFSMINKEHPDSYDHQLLGDLGKALEAGKNMYLDLQDSYLIS